jgi:hypothetical protein
MPKMLVTFRIQLHPENDPDMDEDSYTSELQAFEDSLYELGVTSIDLEDETEV